MADRTFSDRAGWLLRRLLLALLVALALSVVARQFVDGGGGASTASPTPPRAGQDHWHATYQVFVCGERQPPFAFWEGGVHTHDDGVIHIHPLIPSEEGEGARLVKWFEYGGGELTQSEMRMPGQRDRFANGDRCPDGAEGVLQVYVNGERLDDWSRYIPQDGDRVGIEFGPEQSD